MAVRRISLAKLLAKMLGNTSRFRKGDTVALKGSNSPDVMVVIEILDSLRMENPLIHCQWYESETKQNRKSLFREEQLDFFDWNSAQANRQERTQANVSAP